VHFVPCLGITNNASILISLLFHFSASTCFGNCVPSTESSSDPSELHVNLDFWLIKFYAVCGCVYIMWQPGASGCHVIYTKTHIAQNFINQKSKLACNSEGTDELPVDGTQLTKHVAAAK
jgi:hypothetical protein